MTGFTHVHLPLVSDYSQVLRARQDSLESISCATEFTCKYKSAQHKLLVSIFNSSAIASNHSRAVCLLASHEPSTRVIFKISRGTKHYSRFFVNLDVSCTIYATPGF